MFKQSNIQMRISKKEKINIENPEKRKKNLLLSIPRTGNHIIRTLIELFTQYPTAGLMGLDEIDCPIYLRSNMNFDIIDPNQFSYYKQHDVILPEPHYVLKPEEVNELIFITRHPLEIFIREDTYKSIKYKEISYKQQFKEVYFSNLDFYHQFQGRKLFLYYEDIIEKKDETIKKVYDFLNIKQEKKLELVLKYKNFIYDETLKLSKTTNGGISKGSHYFAENYKNSSFYKDNMNYIVNKMKDKKYYQDYLDRYTHLNI
jgi:hypothetical protein